MVETAAGARPRVAVLLAGGGADDSLARRHGVASKAHVPFEGVPLAQLVLQALVRSRSVDRVIYVGAPPAGVAGAVDACVPGGRRLADSLALGLGAALALAPAQLLLVTADLPWLTPDSVDRFVAETPQADLVYPIVEAAVIAAQFPGQRRTFVRTHDGRFTGGNVVLLAPAVVAPLLPFIDRLERGRKNPLALSTLFGPAVIWGLLRGSLRVADLERRASYMLGATARAFISDDGALAVDIDRAEHLGTAAGRPAPAERIEEVSP